MIVACIAALWIAFAATHMGLSSTSLRPKLVGTLGAAGFQALYSLVALAIFVPLVWLYFTHQHAGPPLWYLGRATPVRWLAYVGMALALVLVVGGVVQPSPVSMTGGDTRVRGVLRISRHPMFMGVGLFGLAHLLTANVNAAELAFFAGFPLFAWLGCRHQDARKLASLGDEFRRFHDETPFLPFSRPGGLQGLREMPLAIALGVGLAIVIRYFHTGWFGGAA